ncbi:MAG: hypothetical protein Q9157_007866 [Trypethelium eluteriae]
MFCSFFLLLTALVGLSSSSPTPWEVPHEQRHASNLDWNRRARVDGDTVLPMKIALAQTNLEKGHDYLMQISDPQSPKYGKYWTAKEVHEAFAPADGVVTAVKQWLTSAGIESSRIIDYENKGWLAFDATAKEAETLLRTEFYEHEHKHSSKIRVGCSSYHVPKHLQGYIDYITPGVKLTPVVKRDIKVKRASSKAHKFPKPPARMNHAWSGGDMSWKPQAAYGLPQDLQGCGLNITPPCIKALYHIPNATKATPGNSLGLYEQGDYFSKQDLDLFYAQYAPYVPQGTYPIPALIDGAAYGMPQNSSEVTGESDIDIDMAYSLIYPQTVTLYQVDDQIYEPQEVATTNLFNTFLDALDGSYCNYTAYGETGDDPSIDPVYPDPAPGGYKDCYSKVSYLRLTYWDAGQRQCGIYKPTNVISASYGQAEHDLPINYSKRQCNEFMKLALQGHSILVASGDYGVGSFPNDGAANGCLGPQATIFNPQYPSNCPYITSVGGTLLYGNQTVLDRESVMHVNLSGTAQNFTSAGGFSNYYGQPSYQKAAVARYLTENSPPYPYYEEFGVNVNSTQGIYNRIGRGYPDVAANGANFRAYTNGIDEHWYGSSLASPLFASVLTLINEERFAANKTPVGFVNPVLYAHPEVLNDIVNGTNVGCGTEGFHAAAGWDPATGLGTPNYPRMLELFMSLP